MNIFVIFVTICGLLTRIDARITFYPPTNSSMLEVESDIFLEVYYNKTTNNKTTTHIENVTLQKDHNTEVSSNPSVCFFKEDCRLTIKFIDNNITLNITMKYDSNRIPGYWEWKNLTINGTVGNITINASSNGNMDIHPNGPGFTRNQLSDISCERKYSSCAPLQLSWSCDNQEFSSLGTVNETVKITFPGLQLQPFFNSGNGNGVKAIRFGPVWSCDPLLSIPVLTGLVIGLGLLVGFNWAVGMISKIKTNNHFDDQKAKEISVPPHDK